MVNEQQLRFLELVQSMRTAQKEYFILIAKAKKTRAGADFAQAANKLKQSKALEADVDVKLQTLTQ